MPATFLNGDRSTLSTLTPKGVGEVEGGGRDGDTLRRDRVTLLDRDFGGPEVTTVSKRKTSSESVTKTKF